jgi:hypothetical protein
MTTRTPILLLAPLVAAAAFSMSRDAHAQPYDCGSIGNGFSGQCFNGISATGLITSQFISTNRVAVEAGDSGDGVGVLSGSDTGIGVAGYANFNLNDSTYHPGGRYGVYGSTVQTAGPTDTNTYGVFGYGSSGNDGVHGLATGTNSGVAGINSGGGHGVYGSISDGGYAIYGNNGTSGGAGWAGYFSGDVKVTGNFTVVGNCNNCSDIRLKQNVKPLNGALDQLLQLKGVSFEWKDPAKHGHENETGTVTGFIAQDVEKVFPEWVHEDGYTARDGQTYRTLELRQIEALEVESIRELKIRIDAQDKLIAELKENRRPLISYNPNWGIFAAGLVIGGVLFMNNRRKRSESDGKA